VLGFVREDRFNIYCGSKRIASVSRDAESSERSAPGALRSEDSASRLTGSTRNTMFNLPLSQEPFSPQPRQKTSRLRGATVTEAVCPYCAVGCGQLIYTKRGQIIDIEGNPESPINEGTLCPKGANAYQLAVNPHRVTEVLYRAPFSDHWEKKSLDWALDTIASRSRRRAMPNSRPGPTTRQRRPHDRHPRRSDDRQRRELPD